MPEPCRDWQSKVTTPAGALGPWVERIQRTCRGQLDLEATRISRRNTWEIDEILVGGLEHEFDVSIHLGMSSSQLMNIFQRG